MKSLRSLPCFPALLFVLAVANASIFAQTSDDKAKFASITAHGLSVRFEMASPSASVVTISTPDGRTFTKQYSKGATPEFTLTDQGERLPDGNYTYEIRVSPTGSAASKKAALLARGRDDDPESVRAARKRVESNGMVQSGSFSIANGVVFVAGATEGGASGVDVAPKPTRKPLEPQRPSITRATFKIRQHHMRLMALPDQVIPDDLIVQGSACVGLDCVNNEAFNFDTIRMKENNTRLQFNDTSTAAGFPTTNWQIRANSSASGGASFLAFVDQGATGSSESGTIVLEVDAGAPANSLRVASTGRVGLRTATPVLDLHINTGDTPAHRLEQNSGGGFGAQTWDIAGNEANFFVRDVTSGSRLPFRIRPGAPTSSLDISADGDVGIGTAGPNARLHLVKSTRELEIRLADAGSTPAGDVGVQLRANAGSFLGLAANGGSAIGIVIDNSNRVGISTDAPTDNLSVNGTASKPGGGSWAVFSDERLKNVKGQFNTGLHALMQLQPIRYEYKSNNALGLKSIGEHIGFGAQELQKVIPEAVVTTDTGYLQVNNDPIIWTMLNAIKEQQAEIEKLKEEVKQLKAAAAPQK